MSVQFHTTDVTDHYVELVTNNACSTSYLSAGLRNRIAIFIHGSLRTTLVPGNLRNEWDPVCELREQLT